MADEELDGRSIGYGWNAFLTDDGDEYYYNEEKGETVCTCHAGIESTTTAILPCPRPNEERRVCAPPPRQFARHVSPRGRRSRGALHLLPPPSSIRVCVSSPKGPHTVLLRRSCLYLSGVFFFFFFFFRGESRTTRIRNHEGQTNNTETRVVCVCVC